MKEKVDYYMGLPYTIVIQPQKDNGEVYYTAIVLELDGCRTDGETRKEALENIKEAMEGWIETKLANGYEVPEPLREMSGKITLRMPKTLHRQLALKSSEEGVSLNQYIVYKLSN